MEQFKDIIGNIKTPSPILGQEVKQQSENVDDTIEEFKPVMLNRNEMKALSVSNDVKGTAAPVFALDDAPV